MTWDEIFILLIMVMGLFAIDMLVAKFNLKAGRIAAVLTFFVLFPLGLVAGIAALICMNSKGKHRKFSITAFFKNVLFHAFFLGIILLYLIDMILLKIFPDATFPVVFLSFCLSPLFIVLLVKVLDYFKDIKQKPTKKASTKKTEFTAKPMVTSNTKNNELGSAKDWDLEYATSIDDLHMRMIGLQGCKNLEEFKRVRPDLDEQITEAAPKIEEKPKKMISLVIPEGTTEIKEREFRAREDIISVVIPESVKKIGELAFFSCENLEKVTILRGVIDIGANAFAHCTNLSSLVIPDSVTTIGQAAFYHCTKLTSIVIPKSIKEIGHSAFSDCENLTDVTVKSESETRIEQNAFGGCHNLSSVKLHEGVISIGVGAFGECTNLSSVVIPDSVVWLGGYAFENCVNLTRVALSKKINSMGGYVFYGCKNLTSIDIPENIIPDLCSNGSLSGCSALKSFKIPDGVTEIANSMFSNCENLTTVEIPDTVEQIGSHAFSACKNLEYVKLPSSVKTIGEGAFDGCEKISDNIKITALSKIPRIVPVATSYNTPYDDPQCDDNFNPDKYNYELRVARNGREYYARIN